ISAQRYHHCDSRNLVQLTRERVARRLAVALPPFLLVASSNLTCAMTAWETSQDGTFFDNSSELLTKKFRTPSDVFAGPRGYTLLIAGEVLCKMLAQEMIGERVVYLYAPGATALDKDF